MLQRTFILGIILVACAEDAQDEMMTADTATEADADTDADSDADTDTDTDADADTLAIAGTYLSNFGATYTISETSVSVDYGTPDTFAVASFDNAAGIIIAQNASTNTYNADLWSRFEWVVDGQTVFWCQQAFDEMSATEAENADPADRADPEMGGCGVPANNFPFTGLTPE
ncbi:MAG: hypothetical protein AAF602_05715 [Myxococcota bacterium]